MPLSRIRGPRTAPIPQLQAQQEVDRRHRVQSEWPNPYRPAPGRRALRRKCWGSTRSSCRTLDREGSWRDMSARPGMKNQYFGDINDYRKYGLLRLLAGAGLSVGVCWLLTPNDGGVDGERRNYLLKPGRWRKHDQDLYDLLRRCCSLELSDPCNVPRNGTSFQGPPTSMNSCLTMRTDVTAISRMPLSTYRIVTSCSSTPDNGIEVESTRRGRRGSARYVYWTELHEAYSSGHSLLVYQHFPHVQREPFVRFLAGRVAEDLRADHVTAFITPHVVFILVHRRAHHAALEETAAAMLRTWRGQIDIWRHAAEPASSDARKVVVMQAAASPGGYTAKQGQYLAFIYYYTKIHGTAPAEADVARYFEVSAPAVHQMIVTLTARGLIKRTPGQARSIRLGVSRAELPDLE